MIYELEIPLPKNTALATPAVYELPVHPGIVKQVEIYFPRGCAGLAHVRIFVWGHPIWPTNPDSWFTGDDTLLRYPEDLELRDPPFMFTIYGYNEDDTYPHTPIVRLQITPREKDLATIMARMFTGARGPVTPVGE